MELDFRPFDADNHHYEPLDAFTRYQDPAMRRRGVLVPRKIGSDWPHGEGLAEPLTLSKELTGFPPDEVRMIMRDNVIDLLGGVAVSE